MSEGRGEPGPAAGAAGDAPGAGGLTRATALVAGGGLLGISTLAFFRVPLLPELGDTLALSTTDLGVVTALFAVGRLAADVPAGVLADRVAPGTVYAAAGGLMCAGSALFALADGAATTWVAAAATGVASSLANTTGMTVFSRAGAAARGRSMALFSSALLVGQSAGPALAGLFAASGSWRTAFWIAAVTAALIAVAAAIGIRAAPSPSAPRSAPSVPPSAASAPPREPGADAAPLLRTELWTLFATCFTVFFALGAMSQTLVPIQGDELLGLGAASVGLALGLGGVCRLVGALVAGIVSDRVGRKAALVPGLAASAVGTALLAAVGGTGVWLVGIALLSVGSVGISVGATILGDRTGAARSGRRFGHYRFVGDVGLLSGPLIGAVLFQHVGRALPFVLVAAMLAACAVASALLLRESHPGAAR